MILLIVTCYYYFYRPTTFCFRQPYLYYQYWYQS